MTTTLSGDRPVDAKPGAEQPHPRRRRWRRPITGLLVVAVLGSGAAAFVTTRESSADEATDAAPRSTAEAKVQDLVARASFDGTLDYPGGAEVRAGRDGVVTWLPDDGSTIKRGEIVAKINEKPIPLLYGELPFYRELKVGVDDGADVQQLKKNLDKLGLLPDGVVVDEEFTWGTAQAVKNLQDELGLEETGTIEPGDVALARGKIRVLRPQSTDGEEEPPVAIGDTVTSDSALFSATTADLQVHTKIPVADVGIATEGTTATVTMPDGSTAKGKVRSLGVPEKDDEDNTVVPAVVTLDQPPRGDTLTGTPVAVKLVKQTAEDVLTVPVTSLIALAEGGYALEVVSGGSTRDGEVSTTLTPVEPGMYADGMVEVSGAGITEGTEVVVPE